MPIRPSHRDAVACTARRSVSRRLRTLFLAVLLIGTAHYAFAQSVAPEEQPARQDAPKSMRAVGATTTALLEAQADGSIAGPGLPMLGVTGNLSWHRYLDSFTYKIPETFGNRVDETTSR